MNYLKGMMGASGESPLLAQLNRLLETVKPEGQDRLSGLEMLLELVRDVQVRQVRRGANSPPLSSWHAAIPAVAFGSSDGWGPRDC